MKILVTGANGFIGKAVTDRLAGAHDVVAATRRNGPDLSADASWGTLLDGVGTVVHCAARVHVMHETAADPLAEFRRVNVQGTLNLARQAAALGVKRFIFISSIKANGEATQPGKPFTTDDVPAPLDAYGISKLEAEEGLRDIGRQTGMEITILRPPLVYGPEAKGNFPRMMQWLWRGVPLPLGAIHNRRSFMALDNMVDLIALCVTHPAAANQTFLASDGDDMSTTQLLRRLGLALGKPARLVPVPGGLLAMGLRLLGKQDVEQRLCGWLQADVTKTRNVLGWVAPVGTDEALRKTALAFIAAQHHENT